MKPITKLSYSLAILALLGFSACGGGGGGASSSIAPTQSSATDVTVERGKVYGATVTDSSTPPQTAKEKANLNVYTFAKKPTYPVMATGGWIDVNGDGKKDAKDVDLDITLKSYSNTVTPVTTYIADANKTIRENRLKGLKDRLNANGVGVSTEITEEELLKVPSKVQNSDFSVLVNAIYKDMKEHGGNLDNSNEDSILSQFDTVKGLTLSTNPKEIEATVMSNLVGAGYANYIPTSELPDENTTTPAENNVTSSSSDGIYVAQTHNSIKTVYQVLGSPLLHDSKAYVRLYRGHNVDGLDVGMKVLSYDLSKFNTDMNISDLPTNILYEQVGPNYTNAHFNQRYYDIAELNNQLYFATMPESVDTLSQSSFIKYDIASDTEIYHAKRDPVMGKNLNTTFDLARGWFLPFDSGNYMGIVEDIGIKVIDTSDGSSYKYGVYDYYGGSGGGDVTTHATPVGNENGFFYAAGNSFKNITYLSNHTTYGSRDTQLDAGYKVNNIFADFNATYTGSKVYRGITGGPLQTAPVLVLDGDTIYTFVTLDYDDADGFAYYDLYLLEYGTDSTLKNVTFIDGSTTKGSYFDVFETYKYGDSLFFKFRHDGKNELCAYNLTKKSFTFRHEIGNNSYVEDSPATSYVITGDTVVIPEIVKNAKSVSEDNLSYYDLVFKVININNGSLMKTLHHPDLDNLQYINNDVKVKASLSDKNAIYFFAERTTQNDKNNLIIKIDSPSNRVQKTRNRFDNHLTGVIKESH